MANTLARRNPLDVSGLRGLFEPIFGDVESQLGFTQSWAPAIDVIRNDDSLTIRADLPGMKPDDVNIEVENDMLTISGRIEQEDEQKDDNYVRRERRFGLFSRSIALPPNVDRNGIEAVHKDGVLEIKIPMPKQSEGGKIEIKPKSE